MLSAWKLEIILIGYLISAIEHKLKPNEDIYIALFEKYQPLFETYRTLHNNPIVCHKKNCTLQIKIFVCF